MFTYVPNTHWYQSPIYICKIKLKLPRNHWPSRTTTALKVTKLYDTNAW